MFVCGQNRIRCPFGSKISEKSWKSSTFGPNRATRSPIRTKFGSDRAVQGLCWLGYPNEASVKISDQSITNSWCKVSRKKKKEERKWERRNRWTHLNTINPLWGRGFKKHTVQQKQNIYIQFSGSFRFVFVRDYRVSLTFSWVFINFILIRIQGKWNYLLVLTEKVSDVFLLYWK